MNLKISRNRIFVETVSILLIFGGILQEWIPSLQYIDEMVSGVCLIYMLIELTKKSKEKEIIYILLLCALLFVIGCQGTITAKLQMNKLAILSDIIAIFKFIPLFWGGLVICSKVKNKQKVWKLLSKITKIFVLAAFLCAILNLFVNIGMYTDYRYGLRSFNFIYSRVGGLYMGCATLLLIQLMEAYYAGLNRTNKLYMAMTLFVMCCTLRTRAFAFVVVFIIGYQIIIKKKKFKLKMWHVLLLGIAVIAVSFSKIQFYFIDNDGQARHVLLKYGIVTAMTYFPFGAGFATYGTNAARKYPSPLYDTYEFQKYYGLGRVKNTYLTDTYWPAIMGEFGFWGLLLMLLIVVNMVVYSYRKVKKNSFIMFAVMYEFTVIIISSFATASFMTSNAAIFLIALAIASANTGE